MSVVLLFFINLIIDLMGFVLINSYVVVSDMIYRLRFVMNGSPCMVFGVSN